MSDVNGGDPVGAGQDDPFDGLSDFGKQFLETQIQDEQQRVAFAPHVKAWDKGANAQFQKIHEQYKPWRDLGDPDQVKTQINFVNRFNADPEGTLRILLENDALSPTQIRNLLDSIPTGQPSGQVSGSGDDDIEAKIQAAVDARLGKTEQTVGALAQQFTQSQQAEQQRQAAAQLDTAISGMKQKYGNDFHEDLVLAMAAQSGLDLEAAHQVVSKTFNSALQARIPPRAGYTMPGTGSGASFNKSPADLTDPEQRKAYVAAELARRNAQ
jgi:hypothetical protein